MRNTTDIVRKKVDALFAETVRFRRHMHSNPELSFQEYETSAFISSVLAENNIGHHTLCQTGVVGLIGNGENCVALRADIDALPIFEETGLEYKSLTDGRMHACGHDMHTSMLLTAAIILKEMENELPGQVKLIFQLGEEKLPGGASLMIKEGVLENPKPSAIFGQHIYPGEQVGKIQMAPGYVMGAADEIYWTIKGKSTHAAQPHLGFDPIVAATQLINYYQTLMTKFRDPLTEGVLSVTYIQGGTTTNIIPEEVKLMGTFRSFDPQWRLHMHRLIEENSDKLCSLYGCGCEVEVRKGFPAVFNHEQPTRLAWDTALEVMGEENTSKFVPKMWGEDFAYYGQRIPASFWFLGVRPEGMEEMPALHNSRLAPDEEAMKYGAQMLVMSAINYLTALKG